MTIHKRRVIREAVVALLAGGSTSAGTRVHDEPYDPRLVFPALSVWDVGEQQLAMSLPADANRVVERRLTLEVAAEVQQIATYARTRDDLLADVERLLATNAIAGVKSVAPVGYAPQRNAEGDKPLSIGRQRFEFLYYTTQGDPSVTL